MTSPKDNADDYALLARLNALKKSTIDLDAKKPVFEPSISNVPVDPAPARALHTDLVSRFKSLNGQPQLPQTSGSSTGAQGLELLADEDGKTVEDLLAELGPEDSWNHIKDEESQIRDLLKTAHQNLQGSRSITASNDGELNHESADNENTAGARMSEDRKVAEEYQSEMGQPSEEDIDREADEYIAQVLEELRLRPQTDLSEDQEDQSKIAQPEHEPRQSADLSRALHMPSAPEKDIEPPPSYTETTADDDLASRFASLGLPSVPKTIQSPSTKQTTQTNKQPQKGFTDDEIDSWCIICNEDATLRCKGCDDDLYCTNCWLDGHKGPDAGYEERTHKAVQYNKGGGMKKQPARRTLIGA